MNYFCPWVTGSSDWNWGIHLSLALVSPNHEGLAIVYGKIPETFGHDVPDSLMNLKANRSL